jgi:hypothetical protein
MLDTKPKPPRTNHTNYECYARTLNDCSEEITREHFISKALLERLKGFEGTGMAWNPGPLPLGPNALRSWVLCKRHNNALSPLDGNIVQLYDLMRRFQDRKLVGDLVLDGEDIERWSIKAMCGLFASGIVEANGQPLDRSATIPKRYMRILFGYDRMPRQLGFAHAHTVFGDLKPTAIRARVDVTPGEKKTPNAMVFSLVGFTWITCLDYPPPAPHVYRPSHYKIGDGSITLRWRGVPRTEPPTITLFERADTDYKEANR